MYKYSVRYKTGSKSTHLESVLCTKRVLCVGFCTHDEDFDFSSCPNRRCVVQKMTEKEMKRPLFELLEVRRGR